MHNYSLHFFCWPICCTVLTTGQNVGPHIYPVDGALLSHCGPEEENNQHFNIIKYNVYTTEDFNEKNLYQGLKKFKIEKMILHEIHRVHNVMWYPGVDCGVTLQVGVSMSYSTLWISGAL